MALSVLAASWLSASVLGCQKPVSDDRGRAFYQGRHGLHYAEARYLLYALQEKGLLIKYYRALVAGLPSDPTGYAALAQVLGDEDMGAFQRGWERDMLKLAED